MINPWPRFFPNLNDAPYGLLPSNKQLEIFNDLFLKKPTFLTFNTPPQIKIFFKIVAVSLFLLYWPMAEGGSEWHFWGGYAICFSGSKLTLVYGNDM